MKKSKFNYCIALIGALCIASMTVYFVTLNETGWAIVFTILTVCAYPDMPEE